MQKVITALELLSTKSRSVARALNSISKSSSEENIENALNKARKLGEQFKSCIKTIVEECAPMEWDYENSADLSFDKALNTVISHNAGEPTDFDKYPKALMRILNQGDRILEIDDNRHVTIQTQGSIWLFAAIRVLELADKKLYETVWRLMKLRETKMIDDRDLYYYAGRALGRQNTYPYFYIKPCDLQDLQKNIRDTELISIKWRDRLAKYSGFVTDGKSNDKGEYNEIVSGYSLVTRRLDAFLGDFREQVEAGPRSLDQIWADYEERTPAA